MGCPVPTHGKTGHRTTSTKMDRTEIHRALRVEILGPNLRQVLDDDDDDDGVGVNDVQSCTFTITDNNVQPVPCFRRLVASISHQRPGVEPRTVRVGLLAED